MAFISYKDRPGRLALGFVLLAGAAAMPAPACRIRIPSAELSVIHSELPPNLPPRTIVAEVEFVSADANWERLIEGTQVRIKRMIQGDFRGETMIVREARIMVTCYSPFPLGTSGFFVGNPVGYENGMLVVEPIWVRSPDYRLSGAP